MNWKKILLYGLILAAVLLAGINYKFFANELNNIGIGVPLLLLLVLLVVITLLNVLALTTYRFRVFQVRTTVLAALVTLGLQAWLVVDFVVSGNDPLFHVTAIFPLVAVILDVLAARGIWADELMVRSSDRLRSSKRKKH